MSNRGGKSTSERQAMVPARRRGSPRGPPHQVSHLCWTGCQGRGRGPDSTPMGTGTGRPCSPKVPVTLVPTLAVGFTLGSRSCSHTSNTRFLTILHEKTNRSAGCERDSSSSVPVPERSPEVSTANSQLPAHKVTMEGGSQAVWWDFRLYLDRPGSILS